MRTGREEEMGIRRGPETYSHIKNGDLMKGFKCTRIWPM
jgi:hypothetical protein